MPEADWLSDPANEPATPDYLAIPALDKPSIEVARVDAPLKDIRFEVMKGTDRVWACNGRYVACRPSGFHDASRRRHSQFMASGHYVHVGTFDDVQLFELTPQSPFYRTEGDVRAGSWYELLRATAKAAVAQDWGAYVDLLEEITVRLKSTPTGTTGEVDLGLAKDRFMDTLAHLEQLVQMRGGPLQAVIDAGVANIRRRRGAPRSRVIALPSPQRVQ